MLRAEQMRFLKIGDVQAGALEKQAAEIRLRAEAAAEE